MIYNDEIEDDLLNLLRYINNYTKQLGIVQAQIDVNALANVCLNIRKEFPHIDGLVKASAFKKCAYFIVRFLEESPIKTSYSVLKGPIADDINAVVAFDIAITCLQNSKIGDSNGGWKKVDKQLYVSNHSYGDIIDALCNSGNPGAGEFNPLDLYKVLSVLLEQIVYKTNRHCEYPPEKGGGHYQGPFSPTDGDDMMGA